MQLFVYEFITGGGTLAKPSWGLPHGSLLAEGSAMIRAITDDLVRLPNLSVTSMWDARLPATIDKRVELVSVFDHASEAAEYDRLARTCDATLVIAPEIEDELHCRCQRIEEVGGTSMGSNLRFIRLASDKQATIELLQAAGVRVPQSEIIGPNTVLKRSEPVMVKPKLGAGSQGLLLIHPDDKVQTKIATDGTLLLQSFCAGMPTSISFICGKQQVVPLIPFFQNLGEDFFYGGGKRITQQQLQERVIRLGRRAMNAFDGARGYVGVDVVLGENEDGSDDTVIEVNPRLTTSYIGNRAIIEQNLASCMLGSFHDQRIEVTANSDNVSFTPDGICYSS